MKTQTLYLVLLLAVMITVAVLVNSKRVAAAAAPETVNDAPQIDPTPNTGPQTFEQAITNAIISIDAKIYAPYGNLKGKQAATGTHWGVVSIDGRSGNIPNNQLGNLEYQWEVVKWQISKQPFPVFMLFNTDGTVDNIGRSYINLYGTNYYRQTNDKDRGTVLRNFIQNWQRMAQYQPASDGTVALNFLKLAVNMIDGNYYGIAAFIITQ